MQLIETQIRYSNKRKKNKLLHLLRIAGFHERFYPLFTFYVFKIQQQIILPTSRIADNLIINLIFFSKNIMNFELKKQFEK